MTFFLARELGMTRRELLRKTDSRELSEWFAFYLLEAEKAEQEAKEQEREARGEKVLFDDGTRPGIGFKRDEAMLRKLADRYGGNVKEI